MNEHMPPWKRFTTVTPEAALAILRAKLPDFKCLACGSQELSLIGDPSKNQNTRVSVYQFPEVEPYGMLPTLCFECNSCGYVHTFIRETLDPDAALKSKDSE